MTVDWLTSLNKDELPGTAQNLTQEDIRDLVDFLSRKEDNLRYNAILLLQHRSEAYNDVYPFWERFTERLKSDNSYQRSIGLLLMAENARWDSGNGFDSALDDYLKLLLDEKPITVRQCIQSLQKIVPYKPELCGRIAERLMMLDLTAIKETMRKLILMDILYVLTLISKQQPSEAIKSYFSHALSGDILDKKSKKQIEAALNEV